MDHDWSKELRIRQMTPDEVALWRAQVEGSFEPPPFAAGPSVTCIDGHHDLCGGYVTRDYRCPCECHVRR
jgi:hypothetical protein